MVHFYLIRDGILREDRELRFSGSPRLVMDADADIKTSFSGAFEPREDVNFLQDRIFCRVNGEDCGEFLVTACRSIYDGSSELWQIEACDQGWLPARQRQETRLSVLTGQDYMELIQSLLTGCGIHRIKADECMESLQCDRQWEPGVSTLTIINELLEEIGFEPLWFDPSGYARLSAYQAPSGEAVTKIYRSGDALLEPDCVSSWDIYGAKNVFMAVADSPERDVSWIATAVNDDANSPISTVNLGRIMAPLLVVENVPSQAALQTIVDRLRDESLLSAQELTFHTALQVHSVGEMVALEHPQAEGIFRESGWIMDLGEGTMTHTGRRYCYL